MKRPHRSRRPASSDPAGAVVQRAEEPPRRLATRNPPPRHGPRTCLVPAGHHPVPAAPAPSGSRSVERALRGSGTRSIGGCARRSTPPSGRPWRIPLRGSRAPARARFPRPARSSASNALFVKIQDVPVRGIVAVDRWPQRTACPPRAASSAPPPHRRHDAALGALRVADTRRSGGTTASEDARSASAFGSGLTVNRARRPRCRQADGGEPLVGRRSAARSLADPAPPCSQSTRASAGPWAEARPSGLDAEVEPDHRTGRPGRIPAASRAIADFAITSVSEVCALEPVRAAAPAGARRDPDDPPRRGPTPNVSPSAELGRGTSARSSAHWSNVPPLQRSRSARGAVAREDPVLHRAAVESGKAHVRAPVLSGPAKTQSPFGEERRAWWPLDAPTRTSPSREKPPPPPRRKPCSCRHLTSETERRRNRKLGPRTRRLSRGPRAPRRGQPA
jgi:hypothetical protein